MTKFKKIETTIKDLFIIEPMVFGDNRGFFMETYSKRDFEELGIQEEFVQDNHSKSNRGVLRGIHFQKEHTQGKLIRVVSGRVLDVAVDLRKNSPTFGKWFSVELSANNKKMYYVPKYFAHGFLTLEDNTEFIYKCTDYYHPESDSGIHFKDETVSVNWELERYGLKESELLLSEKDKNQLRLKEIDNLFI